MAKLSDQWTAGSSYEDFMGRWSRRLAAEFLAWLEVPAGVDWLDVGCGTGALTRAICERARPASVVGCDPSEALIQYARARISHERCSFEVAGVGSLPGRQGGYGSVTSSLALNFFPDPRTAIGEMQGLTARGGAVSASVWDYSGRMEFLRYFWDAASSLDPDAGNLDEGKRFPICRPEALTELFGGAGLRDMRCEPLDIVTPFTDFHDYWRPFLGGTGPAPSYVASLGDVHRAALADALERTLPRQPDGTIVLTARAWAIRGLAL